MSIDVSVVIPSKDRADSLERCLVAATAQTLPPDRYEVLVVDDGPSRDTREVVERVAEKTEVPVRYLANKSPVHGPAAARNIGWHAASAPVVAFTDDDTLPDRDWLKSGAAEFERDPDVAGVAGRVVVPLPMRPTDHERDTAGLEQAEFITANAFYRKSTLEDVGGFDERFGSPWREDADLYYTLLERGEHLAVAPWAIVVHPTRPERWGSSLKQQGKTAYNALLKKKHPTLYRDRLGTSPRWHWVAVLSLPLAVWSLSRGRPRAAAAAVGTWLGLTSRFAAQRLAGSSHRPSHIAEMAVTSALIPFLSIYARLKGAAKYRVMFW